MDFGTPTIAGSSPTKLQNVSSVSAVGERKREGSKCDGQRREKAAMNLEKRGSGHITKREGKQRVFERNSLRRNAKKGKNTREKKENKRWNQPIHRGKPVCWD